MSHGNQEDLVNPRGISLNLKAGLLGPNFSVQRYVDYGIKDTVRRELELSWYNPDDPLKNTETETENRFLRFVPGRADIERPRMSFNVGMGGKQVGAKYSTTRQYWCEVNHPLDLSYDAQGQLVTFMAGGTLRNEAQKSQLDRYAHVIIDETIIRYKYRICHPQKHGASGDCRLYVPLDNNVNDHFG